MTKKTKNDSAHKAVQSLRAGLSQDQLDQLSATDAQSLKYFEAMKAFVANPAAGLGAYFDTNAIQAMQKIVGTPAPGGTAKSPEGAYVPTVTVPDESGRMIGYDLFSLLMKERIVLINGQVEDTMASIAKASLLFLSHQDPKKEIKVFIDSPGGSVTAGLGIYDVMTNIAAPVLTRVVGMAASMGSILLVAGDKREATANSWIMLHQPLGGSGERAQATEQVISAETIMRMKEQLTNIYVRHTGLTHEYWDVVLERDTWISAQQGVKMGFVDRIIEPDKPRALHDEFSQRANPRPAYDDRHEKAVEMAQDPQYWTPSLAKLKEAKVAEAAPANQNKKVAVVKPAKAATPKAPGQ